METLIRLDPLDASEFFSLCIESMANGQMELSWPSSPGLFFNVIWSDDLQTPVQNWPLLLENVPSDAVGDTTSVPIDADQERAFFSIELQD